MQSTTSGTAAWKGAEPAGVGLQEKPPMKAVKVLASSLLSAISSRESTHRVMVPIKKAQAMERHFDADLRELKERVIHMGSLVEKMVAKAVQGVMERTTAHQPEIFKHETGVNALQIEIDAAVIRLLALHQPVAHDLRFLLMASKIVGELERVADLAVNTSQSTQFLAERKEYEPPQELASMVEVVRAMVTMALDAVVREDVEIAQKVLDTDDQVDGYKRKILDIMIKLMEGDSKRISWGVSLILISRNLERVGDYATNVAEEVIYMVQSREVRHHHQRAKRNESGGK